MDINIEIKAVKGLNLNHLSNIAVEYFGTTVELDDKVLRLVFQNSLYAQSYRKVIQAYFSDPEQIT